MSKVGSEADGLEECAEGVEGVNKVESVDEIESVAEVKKMASKFPLFAD